MPSSPLYPFGYGLSYTTFAIGNLHLNHTTMAANSPLTVSVDLQNTGHLAGDEVVQLYTHQRAGSASRPVRELKGFRRVSLQPGEKQTVTLALTPADLAFWSPATRRQQSEPGTFDLWVGSDSSAPLHTTFVLGDNHARQAAK